MKTLLQNSSVFILTSRNEGLPMALIEAMSQGCACIAFDCKTGPADIITNNVDGILVKDQDIKGMTQGLSLLLSREDKRNFYSKNAVNSSVQFTQKIIIDKWEEEIKEVIHNPIG